MRLEPGGRRRPATTWLFDGRASSPAASLADLAARFSACVHQRKDLRESLVSVPRCSIRIDRAAVDSRRSRRSRRSPTKLVPPRLSADQSCSRSRGRGPRVADAAEERRDSPILRFVDARTAPSVDLVPLLQLERGALDRESSGDAVRDVGERHVGQSTVPRVSSPSASTSPPSMVSSGITTDAASRPARVSTDQCDAFGREKRADLILADRWRRSARPWER